MTTRNLYSRNRNSAFADLNEEIDLDDFDDFFDSPQSGFGGMQRKGTSDEVRLERIAILQELNAEPPFPIGPVFTSRHELRLSQETAEYLQEFDELIAQANSDVIFEADWHERSRLISRSRLCFSTPRQQDLRSPEQWDRDVLDNSRQRVLNTDLASQFAEQKMQKLSEENDSGGSEPEALIPEQQQRSNGHKMTFGHLKRDLPMVAQIEERLQNTTIAAENRGSTDQPSLPLRGNETFGRGQRLFSIQVYEDEQLHMFPIHELDDPALIAREICVRFRHIKPGLTDQWLSKVVQMHSIKLGKYRAKTTGSST